MRIDIHVHMAPLDGLDGTFLSPRLRGTWRSMMFTWAGKPWELQRERLGQSYAQRLASWVEQSAHLDAAVLLPMDGRYDARGHLDRHATDVYVSNDCVRDLCRNHTCLLPGASIHPLRRDAADEVHRVREQGAVLIKLLPNTQDFDPLNPRCKRLYRAAAQSGLPLLVHTGREHTLPVTQQRYGHPNRLRLALDEGCTVIAAHAGIAGIPPNSGTFPAFLDLLDRYDNLYGDTSSLFSIARIWYVNRLVGEDRLRGRLLHGSDYPVPILALPTARRIGVARALQLGRVRNPLDRCAALAREVGFDRSVFTKAAEVLPLP